MPNTTTGPAKATAKPSDLADHGKFAELASRRVSNVLAALDTVVKLGRTRGVAITAADKSRVMDAIAAKVKELDTVWTPGQNAKSAAAASFSLGESNGSAATPATASAETK